jgi:hypothetical protein
MGGILSQSYSRAAIVGQEGCTAKEARFDQTDAFWAALGCLSALARESGHPAL